MAVIRYSGDRYSWLSTDTKPSNVLDGAIGVELDTGRNYYREGGDWLESPYAIIHVGDDPPADETILWLDTSE